jgi:simple sugar transport system permease protein
VVAVVVAVLLLVWYLTTDEIPGDFTGMTPYVATLLVLSLSAQRLRMPAADGLRYRRGQGG